MTQGKQDKEKESKREVVRTGNRAEKQGQPRQTFLVYETKSPIVVQFELAFEASSFIIKQISGVNYNKICLYVKGLHRGATAEKLDQSVTGRIKSTIIKFPQ